jgi:hypothetical protein
MVLRSYPWESRSSPGFFFLNPRRGFEKKSLLIATTYLLSSIHQIAPKMIVSNMAVTGLNPLLCLLFNENGISSICISKAMLPAIRELNGNQFIRYPELIPTIVPVMMYIQAMMVSIINAFRTYMYKTLLPIPWNIHTA